jgi:zeta-carotene desaturase
VETRVTGLVVAKGETEEIIKADAYVCACDVPGIQRVLPQAWREWSEFDNIYKLDTVPVATVQLRFDGWVTELQDTAERRQLDHAAG